MIHTPRPLGFRTLKGIFARQASFLKVGSIFFLVAIYITILFSIIFSPGDGDPPEVDYDAIQRGGILTDATITTIETQENITINDRHPIIITYSYNVANKEYRSSFKTLPSYGDAKLNTGDIIPIKYLNNESIIPSLSPFIWPSELYFIPLVSGGFGLICLVILISRIRKEASLMKGGIVSRGKIVSMTHKPGRPITKAGQGVYLDYEYIIGGRTYLGKGLSTDMSLLNTLKQDDEISIFVSPEDPSVSTLASRIDSLRNNWHIDFS